MSARFFIDRPILASVPSIVITLAGLVAVFSLPIAQYPEIAPPSVQVTCRYPGANAQVLNDTVAAPIEQQVNGVEKMLYMSSQCNNDGSYTLTVTFKLGTDLDMAQVLVQNRVSLALPVLPDVVQQLGVTTKKCSPSLMLVVDLYSPDGAYDQLYLSNYATIQIRDELARLEGVGDAVVFGQRDYSMRVWLNPATLASRGMTSGDVVRALQEQNVQVAAGQLGQQPAQRGVDFQYSMRAVGRLTDPEQFGNIILKNGEEGQITRLRDVARIELGARSSDSNTLLDGKPSAAVGVFQLPGSNALDTAERVRDKMKELEARFPQGLVYSINFDTTPFIKESVREVFKTLRDAVILVAVVVLVFLQNWRSTLIPLAAVPVAIIGTFAAMIMIGFSLNNLSLFGLVLATGIVVDNAIVVVEATERHIEEGLTPREASYKAMEELSMPVLAIGLVLAAVFIPCAFISGITGQFFRQFALTIAVSTILSTINSLTLSPALCAILLKPRHAKRDLLTRILNVLLGWFFTLFNKSFDWSTSGYSWMVGRLLRASAVMLLLYVGLLGLTWWSFTHVPAGFIPTQDKGYLFANLQLPDAASLERTEETLARIDKICRQVPGIAHTIQISGMSLVLNVNASNVATVLIILDPFEERTAPDRGAEAIMTTLRQRFAAEIQEGEVQIFGAPPVDGLGNSSGFKLVLEDRGDNGFPELQTQADAFSQQTRGLPGVAAAFSMFRAESPQLFVDIDRTKCKRLGVPLDDVFQTLQINLGGLYINDINLFGRTWQVNVQADTPYRMRPEDLRRMQVRNARGDMAPLGAMVNVQDSSGPFFVNRYNTYPASSINGVLLPGISTGQVIAAMNDLAQQHLPGSMAAEWTELSFLQVTAGNTTAFVFIGAVILVFLVLAGQYESWMLPLAVILVVPMCILCSVIGVAIAGMDNNIFTQIGFVVLVGLASKNAILIVEFAKSQREAGASRFDATVSACRLRLRPILMTSFAFILGVVPLVISQGAGSEMRRTLGVAVFSGMLGVTLFGIFLTPVFYYVIQGFGDRRRRNSARA